MENKLKRRKEKLVKTWEGCFDMPITEVLNEKGIEHFWDDETPIDEAKELLTAAALSLVLDDIGVEAIDFDNLVGVALVLKGGKKEDEKKVQTEAKCKSKKEEGGYDLVVGDKFHIVDLNTNKIIGSFDSYEEAIDEMREIPLYSEVTIKDLKLVCDFEAWVKPNA